MKFLAMKRQMRKTENFVCGMIIMYKWMHWAKAWEELNDRLFLWNRTMTLICASLWGEAPLTGAWYGAELGAEVKMVPGYAHTPRPTA